MSIRDGEHLICPRISAIGHILNQHHCVRPRALAEIADEHCSGAMDELLLLTGFLILAAFGPGSISIDHLIAKKLDTPKGNVDA